MDPKTQKLLRKVEKTGVRQSLKAGHPLGREELLSLKVQLLPAPLRVLLGGAAAGAGWGSYFCSNHDSPFWSILLGMAAILLLLFAVFGIRRTLSKILDNLDAGSAADLLGAAVEGIGSALGSVFDGV